MNGVKVQGGLGNLLGLRCVRSSPIIEGGVKQGLNGSVLRGVFKMSRSIGSVALFFEERSA